jgi:predicted component of type VI protein secretion system
MKTDAYTKIVLTIIAVALTANLLKGFIMPANAAAKNYVTLPVNADGSINVKIKGMTDPMDVNIANCSRDAFFNAEPIPVKVTNR